MKITGKELEELYDFLEEKSSLDPLNDILYLSYISNPKTQLNMEDDFLFSLECSKQKKDFSTTNPYLNLKNQIIHKGWESLPSIEIFSEKSMYYFWNQLKPLEFKYYYNFFNMKAKDIISGWLEVIHHSHEKESWLEQSKFVQNMMHLLRHKAKIFSTPERKECVMKIMDIIKISPIIDLNVTSDDIVDLINQLSLVVEKEQVIKWINELIKHNSELQYDKFESKNIQLEDFKPFLSAYAYKQLIETKENFIEKQLETICFKIRNNDTFTITNLTSYKNVWEFVLKNEPLYEGANITNNNGVSLITVMFDKKAPIDFYYRCLKESLLFIVENKDIKNDMLKMKEVIEKVIHKNKMDIELEQSSSVPKYKM